MVFAFPSTFLRPWGGPFPRAPQTNPTVYTAIYRERNHLHSENAVVAAMWDGRSAERSAERRDVTICTALPQFEPL